MASSAFSFPAGGSRPAPADAVAQPMRLLHLSDLHLTAGQRRKQQWVADLAGLDPDLVVITGDNIAAADSLTGLARAYGRLFSYPGAFVFGSNDYKGPVFKNPLSCFNPDREDEQGEDLPLEELRTMMPDACWARLNNSRTTPKAGGVRPQPL